MLNKKERLELIKQLENSLTNLYLQDIYEDNVSQLKKVKKDIRDIKRMIRKKEKELC